MSDTILPALLAILPIVRKVFPDVVANLSQRGSLVLGGLDCHSDQSNVGEWRLLRSLKASTDQLIVRRRVCGRG